MRLRYISAFAAAILLSSSNVFAQMNKNLYVGKAGTMISQLTEEEANNITHLTLTGKLNVIDFKHLRDEFDKLEVLDISNAEIKTYIGKDGTFRDKLYIYPPNCIPAYAFCRVNNNDTIGKLSLRKVILSEKTKDIEDAAFKGCENLRICYIRKKSAPNLSEEALADSITAIFVSPGARDGYRLKKRWENFAIIEGEPLEVTIQIGAMETLYDNLLKSGIQPGNINFLTVEGKLDNNDFKIIRDYMPNLVSVDISKTNATEIPEYTFTQKKYMLNVKLPDNLKYIGQRAFSGCIRLSGTLELPSTLTAIDFGAFIGCSNLKRVIAGKNLTTVGNELFGDEKSKLIYRK